nr:MAG TPA: hypothetical protein [Caudoviricetes sp.]
MTSTNGQFNTCEVYYNMNTFEKPRLKTLTQFTLADFSAVAAYVVTDYHTVTLLELPPEKTALINLLNSIDASETDKAIDAANKICTGYSAVLQHLPRLTIIDYIKLLADSATTYAADTQLSENWQAAPAILSNLIDKLTTETANRSLRIKQFEAEQRARLRARTERRASLAERELIERRKQRAKQVQAQKTNLKMFIKALSVSTDEATFSQKVLKMADLIDSDLDL